MNLHIESRCWGLLASFLLVCSVVFYSLTLNTNKIDDAMDRYYDRLKGVW